MIEFTVKYTKKKDILHLAIWQNWCFGQFNYSIIEVLEKTTPKNTSQLFLKTISMVHTLILKLAKVKRL